MSGRLISFEGVEGSGKSTLARCLEESLRRCGRSVLALREPGSTQLGERIRSVVLDARETSVEPWSELFLMLAARSQLVRERIEPALAAGDWVLCDRFADASTAYQGLGRGLGRAVVEALNEQATGSRRPDLTLLVDLAPELGRTRQTHAPDRMEREAMEFHRRVREGYLELARSEPQRFRVLDGAQSRTELVRLAWSELRLLDAGLPVQPVGALADPS